jgi:hypothetical protein
MGWPRPYKNFGIKANRYVLVLARRIATERRGRWKMRVQTVRGRIEWRVGPPGARQNLQANDNRRSSFVIMCSRRMRLGAGLAPVRSGFWR